MIVPVPLPSSSVPVDVELAARCGVHDHHSTEVPHCAQTAEKVVSIAIVSAKTVKFLIIRFIARASFYVRRLRGVRLS